MLMDRDGSWNEARWNSEEGRHEIVTETSKQAMHPFYMVVDFEERNRCTVRLKKGAQLKVRFAKGLDCEPPDIPAEGGRVLKSWAVPVLPVDEDAKPLGHGEVLTLMGKNKTLIHALSVLWKKIERARHEHSGKLPVVKCADTVPAGFKPKHKGHEPVYEIVDWVDRPSEFDDAPSLKPNEPSDNICDDQSSEAKADASNISPSV